MNGSAAPQGPSRDAPLAIISGGGVFPVAVAKAAIAEGRRVVLFPVRGFADPALIEAFPHQWIHLGAAGGLMRAIRFHGCRDVVFVGTVVRPRFRSLRLDWKTIALLPQLYRLFRGGDNHLLSGIGRIFEEHGFNLLGPHEVAPHILVPEGVLGGLLPSDDDREDAALGLSVIHQLGRFDIGQAVVVARRRVVAVEAAEGTDGMLERCATMRESGRVRLPSRTGLLVKASKPEQERRIDLPSIGPRTVEGALRASLGGIAVEAGSVIASDLQAVIEAADRAGLFLVGIAP